MWTSFEYIDKNVSWKLPQQLVLTPHKLWALRVLDAIGIGRLVCGQNLNHVLSIQGSYNFMIKILMHNLGCTCISGHMWAHIWLQCNIHYVFNYNSFWIDKWVNLYVQVIYVCFVYGFRMMIQINGVFKLLGGSTSMEPIDCMGVCWFGIVGACTSKGCIGHLNKVVKYRHVWICITIVIWLNLPNHWIRHWSWKKNIVTIREFEGVMLVFILI